MSIVSFLKAVGRKLTGGDDTPTPQDLKTELDSYNLGTKDVSVAIEGDTAVLSGEVADQAAFEKAVLAVGNAHGVAGVNTDKLKVAATVASEPVFYTVKPGDNLWKIAEAQYGKGNGAKNSLIFEANKPMLTSPDKIYPGQVLRIPKLQ